jgi:hypothetical protein
MSDMLTHWATFDDCRRLAQLDETIAPELRASIERGAEAARFGTLTRGGGVWMEPVLRKARARWQTPEESARNERNVAFVLGGLIHQACDRVMKPILTEAGGADWSEMMAVMQASRDVLDANAAQIERTQEASAYFDAEVFRQVYLGGREGAVGTCFLAEMSPEGQGFEAVVRAMFQRSLMAAHTLKPASDDMEAWLDNLFDKVQALPLVIDRWIAVYRNPDPRKVAAFGVRTRFYQSDDPVIRAARSLQAGDALDAELRRKVFDEGASICAYGDVLQTGLSYLRSASGFWRGESQAFTAPNYVRQSLRPSQ